MDANSENIDYRIFHSVSLEFEGDYDNFKKNIKKEKKFCELDKDKLLKVVNKTDDDDKQYRLMYLGSRFRLSKDGCYYFSGCDEKEIKEISEVFLYRNKVLADSLSNKGVLIGLPSFRVNIEKVANFPLEISSSCGQTSEVINVNLFFLISESIVTIGMLLAPIKKGKIGCDSLVETICDLQKPQELLVKMKYNEKCGTTFFKEFEKYANKLFLPIRKNGKSKNNENEEYFLSEIFFLFYQYLLYKLLKKECDTKRIVDIYNKFLDVFDTTIFTTTALSVPLHLKLDIEKKIPNLIQGYKNLNADCSCLNFIGKENLSDYDNTRFFMTYNRFLMIFFRNVKDEKKEFKEWVMPAGFVLNEIVSSIFYSLHFFSDTAITMSKSNFFDLRKSKKFLKRLVEYYYLFFDPNLIQSQLIRYLLDKSFGINKFDSLLTAINDNFETIESVKSERGIFWFTIIVTILTSVIIFFDVINYIRSGK